MRPLSGILGPLTLALAGFACTGLSLAPAASAHDGPIDAAAAAAARSSAMAPVLIGSGNVSLVTTQPTQLGISGCFLPTAALFVASGVDSVRVYDVSSPRSPKLTGVLPSPMFENEAMNCGERVTPTATRRFALIGVDAFQASPDDVQHVNAGGNELVVIDVTNPASPRVLSRTPGTTSTHTVTCVNRTNCSYAYSAGSGGRFSVFDLRDLTKPREVDSDPTKAGIQGFASPTAAHKWNFDAAGIGTHTGFGGASMWDTSRPDRPRLLTTTGKAGAGTDPRYAGWNNFILHNSFRPNARAFKPWAPPSYANGNILLVTEEDYEQTDCTIAGSFQTWWVRHLNGRPGGIIPLDKVELSDLGNFPLPQGAFCSSHWFDWHPSRIVAAGFYGGGTQFIDARNPRDLKPYGHAVWGASEVWDAMWVPVYKGGKQTGAKSNVVYSIDLVRGLDVYEVQLPGTTSTSGRFTSGTSSMAMIGGGALLAGVLRRRRTRRTD